MSQLSSGHLFLRRLQCLKGAENLTASTPTHRWACLGFQRKVEFCVQFKAACPAPWCREGTWVVSEVGGPTLSSRATLPTLQSRAGDRTSLCILCCTEFLCLFNAVGVDERRRKWLCATTSPSPKSEPQLGLGARAAPSSPYPPGLSPAPHPHLLPYVPQAPIHPQCNKMVCSVRLLPLLCGPGEGQNCWGEM